MKIKLESLIELAGIELGDFKIHCATGSNRPLDAFFGGHFEQWQEQQNQKNFECEKILSLIQLNRVEWLFAGVWNVRGYKQRRSNKRTWFEYSTDEVLGLEHLVGHAIVRFEKNFRASYLRGPKYIDDLRVSELLPQRMSIGDFPGYSNVCLPYSRLRLVVNQQVDSWRSALSSVSGIYLISDLRTGLQYVGSASGDEGVWGRWCSYANSGHGGNKELRRLLAETDNEYAENFQFSLLEICDPIMTKDQILARESHWKDCLLSRQFGYNEN